MNTTQLKRFATEARKILLQGVAHRIEGLGFDLKTGAPSEKPQLLGGGAVFMGTVVSESFYNRWMSLFDSIRHRGVREVAEEAAYTWFNRLIAIRILSKQGFISPVLQYESEDIHVPLIVSEARHGRMPEMNERTRKELDELLNDDSKTNEQFALLIVAFCHSNPIINRCFGAITDYTELLLPQDILREGGYVDMLNHTAFISEEDYGSSTLIGWLYQFYISDRKDEVFAKKGKYDADEIAPATQIFTPEWIVEYMVQNTIGRIYLDNNSYAADDFKQKWKYLVDQDQRDNDPICHSDNLEKLRFADLGCGSGHIVGYMFEVLFDLYLYEGYSRREAVEHILKENLTGVDIDQRAKQLATFALLLKACQKDKSFTDAKVMPNILDMPDPFTDDKSNEDNIIREQCSHFILGSDTMVLNELVEAVKLMDNAKTLGSIMKFNISERTRNILQVRLEDYEQQDIITDDIKKMIPYVRLILALTQKYTALVMNPPYMGSNRFDKVLSDYVKTNYSEGKADLFSVFMIMAQNRLAKEGKYAMINMQNWMFLSSFAQLRKELINSMQMDSLLHLGPHTFDELNGEVVQNVSFVVSNNMPSESGTYYRLVYGRNCLEKENLFFKDSSIYKNVDQKGFLNISDAIVAYWISSEMKNVFLSPTISKYLSVKQGTSTGDNETFLRNWNEVSTKDIDFNNDGKDQIKKWYPSTKGGLYRKWYGNNENVVNWQYNGEEIKACKSSAVRNPDCNFKEGLTWGSIGTNFGIRYCPQGFVYLISGKGITGEHKLLLYTLAFCCSKVATKILEITSPSLSFEVGYIASLPLIISNRKEDIEAIANKCITLSKLDWDSHETSWDFQKNPLVEIMKDATHPASQTNGFKSQNQWFEAAKTMVSGHENDDIATENYCEQGEAEDDQPMVTPLPDGGNDVTKPWYDDYHTAVTELEGMLHPTDGVTTHGSTLELCVNAFEKLWTARFMQLHANEEELNRQFIDIYGLQDELTPDVPLNEITILQQGEITIE